MMFKVVILTSILVPVGSSGPAVGDRSSRPAIDSVAARDLGVTVDLSTRRLRVRIGDKLIGSYPVSVGTADHRTPTGTYRLSQVIWNPKWTPPNESWAAGKDAKSPGESGNPMGRVKILFDSLLYIHGTRATGALGEPASHG